MKARRPKGWRAVNKLRRLRGALPKGAGAVCCGSCEDWRDAAAGLPLDQDPAGPLLEGNTE